MSYDEKVARAAHRAEVARLKREWEKPAMDAHRAEVARLKRADKRRASK